MIGDITLGHRDNVFSFEYAALHFRDPDNNRYRYRLEGFDKDWVEAGTERKVTYTNLKAGRYTFQVMASNADGVWNGEPLVVKLRLLPPPWRSWWAYWLYILVVAGILFSFYRFQLRRRLAEAEARRLRELDGVKTKLFTNITHEFRTPLTVILGMVKQIRENPKDWFSEGLEMIERNGKNLLRLVNQMLDLSKLEAGAMPVHVIRGDLIPFLKYQLESFRSLAESKGLQLEFLAEPESLVLDYDPEKMESIISNLLSNALKFTSKGSIELRVSSQGDQYFSIRVKDTGSGIPPESLPHIFERFYQASPLTPEENETTPSAAIPSLGGNRSGGIGLAVTRALVRLLGGTISVESEAGAGTEFTIVLPVVRQAVLAPGAADKSVAESRRIVYREPPASPRSETGMPTAPAEAPVLLIVEDNTDVVRYLQSLLRHEYRIKLAIDGRDGLVKSFEYIPDIILSDVMMPGMDGFELCERLKTDIRTSHIPVILLTARADMSSRIEGLQHGADAYLIKPFHKAELLVRLEKLVELRRHLQARYANAGTGIIPQERPSLDDAFMQQVRNIMEVHLCDEDFSIADLCTALDMSRAQLYRKFQALTDTSVGQYFRSMRLYKAKTLLLTTPLRISEIAFKVGFKDHAYFTRAFTDEFGKSPSKWRKEQQAI